MCLFRTPKLSETTHSAKPLTPTSLIYQSVKEMETKTYTEEVHFPATPALVYETLTNPALHATFTAAPSEGTDELGPFSAFGGYCHGENLELVPGKRIVQTWAARSDNWPEGHFSHATYNLEPEGENGEGTLLRFVQTDVPEPAMAMMEEGWGDWYWKRMTAHFKGEPLPEPQAA